FYRSDAYMRDPWSDGALSGIDADAPVLIIGCGLTMIDVAVSLAHSGHRGAITAVSRRGLVGQPNAPRSTAAWTIEYTALPKTMRALVRKVRDEVARAAAQGVDWRSVVDSLRPHSQRLWRELPPEEQRRFLRHVRAYWEIHRSRTAPINMGDIDAMRSSGRLSVRAGRIQGFRRDGRVVSVTLLPRGRSSVETVQVERVINATGPEGDFRRIGSSLVDGLLSEGWVRPGPYGFGFDATPDGVLLDAKGAPSPFLYSLGPPLRGVLWETLAAPEIREHAGAIARSILGMGVADG
ncbi:MAG: FAD/NAD(P)-binding protein, partial [Candidatus Eiseniibacteriota bacterium]